ncbi:unnamed protein product [Blepharisma stoltei]|uniref:Uncharacterized protein n=1 Tax=Blepharisma stoltei TaxID=1481888 RepID=A0AAU9J0W3_9CILI|nr:unnamed protein product [Blepharisma stoltei]
MKALECVGHGVSVHAKILNGLHWRCKQVMHSNFYFYFLLFYFFWYFYFLEFIFGNFNKFLKIFNWSTMVGDNR